MFPAIGSWAYRYRVWVAAFWVAMLAANIFFALRADDVLESSLASRSTEAVQALEVIQREVDLPETQVIYIFTSDRLAVEDVAYRDQVEAALAGVRRMPEFAVAETVYSRGRASMVSADGRATYAVVFFRIPLNDAIDRLPEIRERTARQPDVEVWLTGGAPIFEELEAAGRRDLTRAEVITLPLVAVALVLIFGGLVAAALPVLVGGASLILALAVMFFLGRILEISVFAQNVASLLALGVAVDYTLFMVYRFREELGRGSTESAVIATVRTAGKAVLVSGITTMLGLSGLLVFEMGFLRSIGLAGIVVVGLSLALALTLVPAVLGLLGPRIDALAVIKVSPTQGHFWARLARLVMRRPLLFLVPGALLLLLLGAPFLGVKMGPMWANELPNGSAAGTGWEIGVDRFGEGELNPLLIAVTSPGPLLEPESVGALFDYTRAIAMIPGVERIESIVDVDPGLAREAYQTAYANPSRIPFPEGRRAVEFLAGENATLVRVFGGSEVASDEAKAIVDAVRGLSLDGGLTALVGGPTAGLADLTESLYADFPLAAVIVLGSVYATLFLLFRSVWLPLKAIVMNGLSIFAAFGALVFVFQNGNLEWLLGIQADGAIEATVPILLFCIIFGLSMDYEVFLLSRIKEEYEVNGENEASVALGLQRSGRIISSAALVIVLVGISFATADVIIVKALGFGLALAVFLDATVVRAVMVPAIMRLFGRWNWWAPASLLRRIPVVE